jgi:hypothetical protein
MPKIFDNIEQALLPALRETLTVGHRADFCVGYFNLRGWRHVADCVDSWAGGEGDCCRLLVGMQIAPGEELRRALSHTEQDEALDNQTALRQKRRIAEDFRRQLTFGVPTNIDEFALQQLSAQLKGKKLVVKVYLPHPLHAKLYLAHRRDANNPMTGVARVLSLSKVQTELPEFRRHRVVLIDESHNLRNREGKRWAAIRDYITRNDSRCILLSATPYNKSYQDLAAQLGLFIKEDADLGMRPERLIEQLGGEQNFALRHQCPVRSLAAFEKSPDPDDWRDLMRLYLVRRTRSFIMQNYAKTDARGRYLEFPDGSKSYFPKRVPKSATFASIDADDPYGRLYASPVVNAINGLVLPR